MASFENEVFALLTTDVFKKIIGSDTLQIVQLNAAITLLIKVGIPFDVVFSPGTRRAAAAAQLTIYINPTTTLEFTISLAAGGSIFDID
ncbi:hypothetical protein [Alkaliphilus peptidifermentans]|nr:hypothetical protein [Alkaliphilus peptidifermentans]